MNALAFNVSYPNTRLLNYFYARTSNYTKFDYTINESTFSIAGETVRDLGFRLSPKLCPDCTFRIYVTRHVNF